MIAMTTKHMLTHVFLFGKVSSPPSPFQACGVPKFFDRVGQKKHK